MVLPFNPIWISATVAALLCANYVLLRNKLHFMLDCAFLLFLGTFLIIGRPGPHTAYTGKILLDMLLVLLSFATMRLVLRPELPALVKKSLPAVRRALILASLILVTATWSMVLLSPRPLIRASGVGLRHDLYTIGTALEKYASDHRGRYPAHLAELAPVYMEEPPSLAYSRLTDREKEFYAKRHHVQFDYAYEVDGSAGAYTLSAGPDGLGSGPLVYTSKEGLIE